MEEEEKVGNLKRKIREEKKSPDKTVHNTNNEKAGKAEKFKKLNILERKMLMLDHKEGEYKHTLVRWGWGMWRTRLRLSPERGT